MSRISFIKTNSFLSYVFPVLEFLDFLAISELSFLQAVSYKKIRVRLVFKNLLENIYKIL